MQSNSLSFIPKQPFMVQMTSSYYKYVVNEYGISHFYSFFVSDTDEIEISVPDGCIDIIFHYNEDRSEIGGDFYGTPLLPHSMKAFKGCTHFGVRFLPGIVPLIADASMPELIDRIIPYHEISKCKELLSLIIDRNNFIEQISAFMSEYLKYYSFVSDGFISVKSGLITEIVKAHGNIKVDKLAEKTNYSTSYIDKVFHSEIGISPKNFSNIMRFQWTLNSMVVNKNTFVDYNAIISDLGYYDQSHMVKEFKKYSKYTPINYLRKLFNTDYNDRLIIISDDEHL